jgi:putative transposase
VRRSPRLPNFDYASPGAHFVTITVHERAALLGSLNLATGVVELSDVGRMIETWWLKLPRKFHSLSLDAHAVMPDHFHGVVLLQYALDGSAARISLSSVLQWFKTMTTADYFQGVSRGASPRVNGRLWQRGFYDHIIRTEQDLLGIRNYIQGNSGALFERFEGRTHGSAPTEP